MTKQRPVPPANRNPHETDHAKGGQKPHNAARPSEHGAKPDQTGEEANMKQNIPHPGSRHDG